ncbi:hypothetical protein BOX15_Mlig013453g1, partial [Macrostomum lignano]
RSKTSSRHIEANSAELIATMSWMTPGNVFRPFSSSSDWPFRSLFDDFDVDEFFNSGRRGTGGSLFDDRRPLDRLRRRRYQQHQQDGSAASDFVRSPASPLGASGASHSWYSRASDSVATTSAGGTAATTPASASTASAATAAQPSASTVSSASGAVKTESPHLKSWTTAIDLVGFRPEEIVVKCDADKLRIRARREEGEDLNEVRRTLTIPAEVDSEKVSTILTMEGALVVKAPLLQSFQQQQQQQQQHQRGYSEAAAMGLGGEDTMSSCSQQDLSWDDVRTLVRGPGIQPLNCLVTARATDGEQRAVSSDKMFRAEILVREFHPQEIKVQQKADQVYVEAESRQEREGQTELRRMERSFTLPRGVDVENLVSRLTEDGRLLLEAPFLALADSASAGAGRSVPIEGVAPAAAAAADSAAGSGGASENPSGAEANCTKL